MQLKTDASGRRLVRCPACGGPSLFAPDNPHRPFCSERCRGHDLGAWATERYRVAAKPVEGDEPDELAPPSAEPH